MTEMRGSAPQRLIHCYVAFVDILRGLTLGTTMNDGSRKAMSLACFMIGQESAERLNI
jgi:hypothetical protein